MCSQNPEEISLERMEVLTSSTVPETCMIYEVKDKTQWLNAAGTQKYIIFLKLFNISKIAYIFL